MRSIGPSFLAFLALFTAYQAPEGVGRLWLHSDALAAVMMMAVLPIAWLVARLQGRAVGPAYGLEWTSRAAAALAAGAVLAFAAKGLALAAGLRWGIYVADEAGGAPAGFVAWSATLTWLALATFVPSVAEDIVTRGFWLRLPGSRWTGPGFVLFTSTVYVLNHVYRLDRGPGEWAMLFCFGLAYGAACWSRRSLWAAVGLHWGWNLAGQALGMAYPHSVVEPELARGLSAAAHLALLVVIMGPAPGVAWAAVSRRRAQEQTNDAAD